MKWLSRLFAPKREPAVALADSGSPAPFFCPREVIDGIRRWLGPRGVEFFRGVLREHGSLNAVWMEDGIPHAVHFREGMRVRNKLRELTNREWTDHDYDNRWMAIVEKAIEENN